MYPSEGIHRRWENGYRITSMAATNEQAAFILSIPKRKLLDETQETLRTSAFPSTHVKVNCISCILLDAEIYAVIGYLLSGVSKIEILTILCGVPLLLFLLFSLTSY